MTVLNRFFFILITLFSSLHSVEEAPKKTVCLNMIVKDETEVIKRCLSSTLPVIDYWVIVDTGSTDGTQKMIRDYMKEKGVPGELHERPWVNFAHNRNEALELARGKSDYIFFIDADEFMSYDDDFKMPELDKDFYYGTISYSGTLYDRIKLVSSRLKASYEGVLHEALVTPFDATNGKIEKMANVVTSEGARSKDPEKYLKDAKTLEKALVDEPNNTRYLYYLAQSYRDAGCHELALKAYEKRIQAGGWDQETYIAMLGAARTQEELGFPKDAIIAGYNRAFQFRPSRKEPLYYLANYYRMQGDYASGYAISKIAMSMPNSKDALFVQGWMDDYGIPLENSICAYWTNQFAECQKVSLQILEKNNLPKEVRECVQNNLGFANAKIIEQICQNTSLTAPKAEEAIKEPDKIEAKPARIKKLELIEAF